MLNCVYHPVEEMRVVEDDEKARLLESGVWFDSPLKAKEIREKYERKIRNEGKRGKVKSEINAENG